MWIKINQTLIISPGIAVSEPWKEEQMPINKSPKEWKEDKQEKINNRNQIKYEWKEE